MWLPQLDTGDRSAGRQGVLGGSTRTPSCNMQSPNHHQVTPQEVMTHLLCVREMESVRQGGEALAGGHLWQRRSFPFGSRER